MARLIVIAGPSGAGKGTLIASVLRQLTGIVLSVSATTRPRRAGEADARDYFFLTEACFDEWVDQGRFLEWAWYSGHRYGTPKDAVDERLINDIKNRTGKLLDSQDEVGGWPELGSKPAPEDADRDGMADAWEEANNLDPKDPEDRNADADKDGYTNLEEYLNSLCPQ